MTTPKSDGAGPVACAPEELLLHKCWADACDNIAAFRDGKGWWWCYFHRDYKGGWDIDEFPSYMETLKGIRKLLHSERAEAEKRIKELEENLLGEQAISRLRYLEIEKLKGK